MDLEQLRLALEAGGPIVGASLVGLDWSDLDGADASFTDCLFQEVRFDGVVLSGARFLRCRFERCRFTHVELRQARFVSCRFARSDEGPAGCSVAFCDLRSTTWSDCDLSLCPIERSDLYGVVMERCSLRGARWQQLDFGQATGRKAISTRAAFRHCNFALADLGGIRLPGCDLAGRSFRDADLAQADLSGADLRGCDLVQAALDGARLDRADLRLAELGGIDLMRLASFAGLTIGQSQQHALLAGIGILVKAGPEA